MKTVNLISLSITD